MLYRIQCRVIYGSAICYRLFEVYDIDGSSYSLWHAFVFSWFGGIFRIIVWREGAFGLLSIKTGGRDCDVLQHPCWFVFVIVITDSTLWDCQSTGKFEKCVFLLCNLLTYSMVQSPSWEANWFAASQEIPRISWNPKVHYRTHKRPPPIPILGQPNPVHIPTSHLLEIHPNIIHPSKRSRNYFPKVMILQIYL